MKRVFVFFYPVQCHKYSVHPPRGVCFCSFVSLSPLQYVDALAVLPCYLSVILLFMLQICPGCLQRAVSNDVGVFISLVEQRYRSKIKLIKQQRSLSRKQAISIKTLSLKEKRNQSTIKGYYFNVS